MREQVHSITVGLNPREPLLWQKFILPPQHLSRISYFLSVRWKVGPQTPNRIFYPETRRVRFGPRLKSDPRTSNCALQDIFAEKMHEAGNKNILCVVNSERVVLW